MGRGKNRTETKCVERQLGPISKTDVLCPICYSMLIEPVTMPCGHSICLECFKKHIEKTSLYCPCCRMRLSVWSRRAIKENSLVNESLWTKIKEQFPAQVKARLENEDSQNLTENSPLTSRNNTQDTDATDVVDNLDFISSSRLQTATPGEIKTELFSLLQPHVDDIENKRREEEAASEEYIKKLQAEEESNVDQLDPYVQIKDLRLAEKLQTEENRNYVTALSERQTVNVSTGTRKSFRSNARRKVELLNSFTTTNKRSKTERSSTAKKTKVSSKPQKPNFSKLAPRTAGSQESILNYTCPAEILNGQDIPRQNDEQNNRRVVSMDSSFVRFSSADGDDERQSTVTLPDFSLGSSTKFRDSTPDSIHDEISCYFRPIRSAPKTPPKPQKNGEPGNPPELIFSTPVRPVVSVGGAISFDDSFNSSSNEELNSQPSQPEGKDGSPEFSTQRISNFSEEAADSDHPSSISTIGKGAESSTLASDADALEVSHNSFVSNVCFDGDAQINYSDATFSGAATNEELVRHREELRRLKMKHQQEVEDRKLAMLLQESINRGYESLRNRQSTNRYSIRSWLKPVEKKDRVESNSVQIIKKEVSNGGADVHINLRKT